MPCIKVEEGRKLTEIKFGTDHYLANLLACTKILGITLSKARTLCKSHPDMNIKVEELIMSGELMYDQFSGDMLDTVTDMIIAVSYTHLDVYKRQVVVDLYSVAFS